MDIKEPKYIGSFPKTEKCPPTNLPEYAFIGRSNVGKSSLINMLTGRSKLARVSKKPGKTAMMNFFMIDDTWILVDLPGYGYAARSKGIIKSFKDMIYDYMQNRMTLTCAFVLIDINVPPQKHDLEFINWLGEYRVPFVIVYTKADRLTKSKRNQNIETIQKAILETWNELPQQFITSSSNKEGREEILAFIEEVNKSVKKK